MPNKYRKPETPKKKPKPKPKKPVKQPKKSKGSSKQKKFKEEHKGDVVTDQLDPNEPLRFNVEKDIKEDKKIKPTDVFE